MASATDSSRSPRVRSLPSRRLWNVCLNSMLKRDTNSSPVLRTAWDMSRSSTLGFDVASLRSCGVAACRSASAGRMAAARRLSISDRHSRSNRSASAGSMSPEPSTSTTSCFCAVWSSGESAFIQYSECTGPSYVPRQLKLHASTLQDAQLRASDRAASRRSPVGVDAEASILILSIGDCLGLDNEEQPAPKLSTARFGGSCITNEQ